MALSVLLEADEEEEEVVEDDEEEAAEDSWTGARPALFPRPLAMIDKRVRDG